MFFVKLRRHDDKCKIVLEPYVLHHMYVYNTQAHIVTGTPDSIISHAGDTHRGRAPRYMLCQDLRNIGFTRMSSASNEQLQKFDVHTTSNGTYDKSGTTSQRFRIFGHCPKATISFDLANK